MAEVLDCVPLYDLETLLNQIVDSRIVTDNGALLYDRKQWNKAIQDLCFDKIVKKVLEISNK